jgi:hypothetical protein
MSKKDKKTEMIIEGTKYIQVRHDTVNDTNWMNIPQVENGVSASGLHIVDKARDRAHWDKFIGKTKLEDDKEYLTEIPKITGLKISAKEDTIFVAPPHNRILVLRGSNQSEEWISLEYYQKNKDKYDVKMGDIENPTVLVLKSKV